MKQKKSKNPLPKTLRPKKRYWVLELKCVHRLDSRLAFSSIQSVLLQLFGSVGGARHRLVFKAFNPASNSIVLQGNAVAEREISLGLLLVRSVGTMDVLPSIRLKTGLLHKAFEEAGVKASVGRSGSKASLFQR